MFHFERAHSNRHDRTEPNLPERCGDQFGQPENVALFHQNLGRGRVNVDEPIRDRGRIPRLRTERRWRCSGDHASYRSARQGRRNDEVENEIQTGYESEPYGNGAGTLHRLKGKEAFKSIDRVPDAI